MRYLLRKVIREFYLYFSSSKLRSFYKLHDKYSAKERFILHKNIRFLGFIIDVPDLESFIWQFKELYVDEIYRFKSLTTAPVILDCGSNIGLSCMYFKMLYPNACIKAFEADPVIANILKNNLVRNRFDDIEVINKAIWIHNDGVEFGQEGGDGGSLNSFGEKVKVESIRLSDYLDNFEIVDLLKIDIEGAELQVIKDCRGKLNRVDNIFIEYHSWNSDIQQLSEILKILESHGFRYYLENLSKREHPLINKGRELNMDLQLNIFGYKKID